MLDKCTSVEQVMINLWYIVLSFY